jgi:ribosomal protein S18 acetylase RimI-like enzyme
MGALRLAHVRYLTQVSLYLKVLEDIVPATGDLVDVQAMSDILQSDALDTTASVLLLDGQDQLVGFLLVSNTNEGLVIDAMAIDKAHQRQGYGRAMMDHVVQSSDQSILCAVDGSHLHPALSRVGALASFLTHYGFTRRTDTTYHYSR